MDALDLLEQQHRVLGERFDEIFALPAEPGAGRRASMIAQLVRAVEAHSRVEETVFYAALSRVDGVEGRLYEGFEDHALLRFAAVNLLRTRITDVRFGARLRLVHDLFTRHALIEEDWMFPKAKRALHDEQLDRIGTEIERAHAARLSLSPSIHERPRPRRRVERMQHERRIST
jgi:hemerythrin superfamily protein